MPTPSGQMQLVDYVTELQARGFDGFTPNDLEAFVNRGYFFVARKQPWNWEKTNSVVSYPAGTPYLVTGPAGTILPSMKSIDKVYVTSPVSYRNKLDVPTDDTFFEKWMPLDLTLAQYRGAPTDYYVFQERLYLLPPPQVDTQIVVYYTQGLLPLVADTDVPVTAMMLDEVILLAALVRCHKRSQEIGLAQIAESDLAEAFDDMITDQNEEMEEQVSRVSPDDTWL